MAQNATTSNSMDVLHRLKVSTISNHNFSAIANSAPQLYLILFLHQTTTNTLLTISVMSCILFCFYIKPQPIAVVTFSIACCILFCFSIKPQPEYPLSHVSECCILFCFYIKPQLWGLTLCRRGCCILFCFYIKPQP